MINIEQAAGIGYVGGIIATIIIYELIVIPSRTKAEAKKQ